MPRPRLTAAEYVERNDAEMRVILGELAENAAHANVQWAAAVRLMRHDPERALEALVDAWVALKTAV
jgi:hypothetical protein